MSKNADDGEGIPTLMFEIANYIVELYLAHIIKPFLTLHDKFYSSLNKFLREEVLDKNSESIPAWFTANFITYARTVLVVPCLLLMAWGHFFLPALIVILVDLGDFLDGVVARYWVDIRKNESAVTEVDSLSDEKDFDPNTYEKPTPITSWIVNHSNRTYGGFIDAICDKAFVVPCWIFLLSSVESSDIGMKTMQYITLWCLILAETASGCIRFKAYYTSNGVVAPSVKGLDFSTSAVKADNIGKAKQTFEMVGTTLFILPFGFRNIGLLLLSSAVPLAYESVRRKITSRVVYVNYEATETDTAALDHKTLKFWKQAKGMGSKLIVGVSSAISPEASKEMILNACASESVHSAVSKAPPKVTTDFLDKIGADYIVCLSGQSSFVSEDVTTAKRCLVIGDDGSARPLQSKGETKEE